MDSLELIRRLSPSALEFTRPLGTRTPQLISPLGVDFFHLGELASQVADLHLLGEELPTQLFKLASGHLQLRLLLGNDRSKRSWAQISVRPLVGAGGDSLVHDRAFATLPEHACREVRHTAMPTRGNQSTLFAAAGG